MIIASIIAFVIVGVFLLVPLFISVFFMQRRKKSRRSPLTSQLLRGPGESLRGQLETASDKMDNFFLIMIIVAVAALGLLLALVNSGKVFVWQLWLLAICYILMMTLLSLQLYRLFRYRQDLYLGLDGERAVGQGGNPGQASKLPTYRDKASKT